MTVFTKSRHFLFLIDLLFSCLLRWSASFDHVFQVLRHWHHALCCNNAISLSIHDWSITRNTSIIVISRVSVYVRNLKNITWHFILAGNLTGRGFNVLLQKNDRVLVFANYLLRVGCDCSIRYIKLLPSVCRLHYSVISPYLPQILSEKVLRFSMIMRWRSVGTNTLLASSCRLWLFHKVHRIIAKCL